MKYLKWSIYFEPEAKEGTTPEEIIKNDGGWAEGGIGLGGLDIIGYTSDDIDLTKLSNYNIQELTQVEALNMAKNINPDCYLKTNGKIGSPEPLIN